MLEVPCQRKPNPCTLNVASIGIADKALAGKESGSLCTNVIATQWAVGDQGYGAAAPA